MIQIAIGNEEDALDLLQDAMMKFVLKYADKPQEEWKPLFYRIVQNKIRDWFRRDRFRHLFVTVLPGFKKESPEEPREALNGIKDPNYLNTAEQMSSHQAIQTLDLELKQLPPRQQQAFLLRAWEGLTVQETAVAMGCSQGSVKTHYSRATARLREKLEGIWP